jgi:4,5-dihydroxyphthalate decarboxylase
MTTILRAAIGDYRHTAALKSGRVTSPLLTLDVVPMPAINRAFAPMVREQRFDVSEMAIATFLQAKSYGKKLVLLPVVLAKRFQEGALLCRRDSLIDGPADLAGRKIGVRAYSQTTGLWLRGSLADIFGMRPEQIRWVTFEDAHVAEYQDPPWAERAPDGSDLLGMLRMGALDAVIVGNDMPDMDDLRPVFPDVPGAARDFWQTHGFVPVNHMVTMRAELAERRPELATELIRMFADSAAAAEGSPEPVLEAAALKDAVALALRYATQQGLLGGTLTLDEVWEGTPVAVR